MNGALNFSRNKFDFQQHGYWHNWPLGAMVTDGSVSLPFFFTVPMPRGQVSVTKFSVVRINIMGEHIVDCQEHDQGTDNILLERNAEVVRASFSGSMVDCGAGIYQYAVRLTRSDIITSDVYHTTLRSEPFQVMTIDGKIRIFTFEFTQEFV
jgi:hypothetical protein